MARQRSRGPKKSLALARSTRVLAKLEAVQVLEEWVVGNGDGTLSGLNLSGEALDIALVEMGRLQSQLLKHLARRRATLKGRL